MWSFKRTDTALDRLYFIHFVDLLFQRSYALDGLLRPYHVDDLLHLAYAAGWQLVCVCRPSVCHGWMLLRFDNSGASPAATRLRGTKVWASGRLFALILLSVKTTLNTTIDKSGFLCYTSLLLIFLMYLSMMARKCFSEILGGVSLLLLRVDDMSCWSRYFLPEELTTSFFFAITACQW